MNTVIISAAVRVPIDTQTIIWPVHRHADFFYVAKQLQLNYDKNRVEQGFIAWNGKEERFVDRVEARTIASAAGQLREDAGDFAALYSEDLW